MYIGILFGLSTLVHLVRLCSIHVCTLFGLSTLVRLVRPCSMYVDIFFGLGTLVRLVLQVLTYVAIFFGLSMLVRLVRPCFFMHVGISLGLSTLSKANCSIIIGMHAWLSSALPQSTACNKDN